MLSKSLPYVADPKRKEQFCRSKGKELISMSHPLSMFAGEAHVHVPLLCSTTQFLKKKLWPAWRTCLSPLNRKKKSIKETCSVLPDSMTVYKQKDFRRIYSS